MEILNHRQKMLDATESNAKRNDNFVAKTISTKNLEEKKCGKSKKDESNLFFF